VAAKEGFTPLFELLEIKDEDVRAKATMTLSILGTALALCCARVCAARH
jgi:hypothetical protein